MYGYGGNMFDYLIAVATVNGPKRLEDFLMSVKEHTAGMNYAISVCDDCSNENLSKQNQQLAQKYGCLKASDEEEIPAPSIKNVSLPYFTTD